MEKTPPNERLFLSHVHKTYTCIVYFIIDSKLISKVLHTKFQEILFSDHSPLTIVLLIGPYPKLLFLAL